MNTKTCTKCGVDKPLDEYGRDKRASDGRRSRCKACQAALRVAYYATNREQELARKPAYYAAHREQELARRAGYYAENREQVLARRAGYYAENRERVCATNAEYRAQNPHIGWANTYRTRARRYGFEPVVEDFTREDVVREYGDRCAHCIDGPFEELDHLVAVRDGGTHVLSGVRPSCRSCNLRRENEAAKARAARAENTPQDVRLPA